MNEREPLDDAEVAKVARLSMLELSADEASAFPSQLNAILDQVAKMNELDTDGVEPTAHPYALSNVFRADVIEPVVDVRDQALAAAPDVEDGQFKVPPALGEES